MNFSQGVFSHPKPPGCWTPENPGGPGGKVFPFLRLVLDIIHRLEAARPGEPEHLGWIKFNGLVCVYIENIYKHTV